MTMDEEILKELIREHWRYNKGIVDIAFKDNVVIEKETAIELMGYYYEKAMLHGVKHGIEERLSGK